MHDKQTSQCNKMKIAFIFDNFDIVQKSPTYLSAPKTMIYENTAVVHTEYISENAYFMQFYVIIPDLPLFIQLASNVIRNSW